MLISENLFFLLVVFSSINVSFGLSPCDMVDYTSISLKHRRVSNNYNGTIVDPHPQSYYSLPFFYLGDREAFLTYKIMLLYRQFRKGH